jgi:hypothetical protein
MMVNNVPGMLAYFGLEVKLKRRDEVTVSATALFVPTKREDGWWVIIGDSNGQDKLGQTIEQYSELVRGFHGKEQLLSSSI